MAKNGSDKSGSAKNAGKKRATKAAQPKKKRAKKTSAKKTSAKKTSAKKTSAKKTPAKKMPPAKKKPHKKSAKGVLTLAGETWKDAHLCREGGVLGVEIAGEGFKTLQELADAQKKIRVIVSFDGAALMLNARDLLDFIRSHAGTCVIDGSTCASG